MPIGDLRDRYIALFGLEPVEHGEIDRMESQLGVRFSHDFKEVSGFYSGGTVGGISHNAIATSGPATNILDETRRLREAVGLPSWFVVLAEPPASLIVMNTSAPSGSPAVIWCDAVDVSRLGTLKGIRNPRTWASYTDFFKFLLDAETEGRGGD